jgi:AraC-like DNA-binding protein
MMSGDPVSDVLRTVRLTGASFFDVSAIVPWVAETLPRQLVLPKILPGADHLIAYHMVVEGECYAGIVGQEPLALKAGEVIVFTNGDPHVLSSSPGMRSHPADTTLLDRTGDRDIPFHLNYGSNGPTATKFICGFLACDAQPFNPLLENLPAVIKAGDRPSSGGGALHQLFQLAAHESAARRTGSAGMLAKLSELMFIEVIRQHLDSLTEIESGWLAGLRDPMIAKALSLMHGLPADDWTLERLARLVGTSRSVLVERFTRIVGMPPMQYLARWRMQIASSLLSQGNRNMASIAAEVGYASEQAFSRAFKKVVGTPPSAARRHLA